MDRKTTGAWIIHHCNKLDSVSNVIGEYDQIKFSGKCGIMLNCLAESEQCDLSADKVNALAKAAGISIKLELPAILDELQRQRLIDKGQQGISILGFTTHDTLEHTSIIFEESDPRSSEKASISISETASFKPLQDNEAVTIISDQFKLVLQDAKELIGQFTDIGFIDSEVISDNRRVLFNGNLFRKDSIKKINGVLSSLSSDDERKVKEIVETLNKLGCVKLEDIISISGNELIQKLHSIGFIDVNRIGNESGIHSFVTLPSAFSKYVSSDIDDAFDLAKAFVTSLTFGITQSPTSRGRIRMIEALMRKLIRGEWVGPATAIGQDYKILEIRGVIEVRSTNDSRFYMRLKKKDIGELALHVILQGEASTYTLKSLPNSSANLFFGPEMTRSKIRKQQAQMIHVFICDLRKKILKNEISK